MSRRECKHGSACGHELCPCDDVSGLVECCDEFEDSGWRRPSPRKRATLEPLLAEATSALFTVEHERPQFGDASLAKRVHAAKMRVSRITREMKYAR